MKEQDETLWGGGLPREKGLAEGKTCVIYNICILVFNTPCFHGFMGAVFVYKC